MGPIGFKAWNTPHNQMLPSSLVEQPKQFIYISLHILSLYLSLSFSLSHFFILCRCTICHAELRFTFYAHKGLPYCTMDYFTRFGSTCKKCRQCITGPMMVGICGCERPCMCMCAYAISRVVVVEHHIYVVVN